MTSANRYATSLNAIIPAHISTYPAILPVIDSVLKYNIVPIVCCDSELYQLLDNLKISCVQLINCSGLDWCHRVIQGLLATQSDYIILLNDDYFLTGVNKRRLEYVYNFASRAEADVVCLSSFIRPQSPIYGSTLLGFLPYTSPLFCRTHPSLYKKAYLLKSLDPFTSIHDFEKSFRYKCPTLKSFTVYKPVITYTEIVKSGKLVRLPPYPVRQALARYPNVIQSQSWSNYFSINIYGGIRDTLRLLLPFHFLKALQRVFSRD